MTQKKAPSTVYIQLITKECEFTLEVLQGDFSKSGLKQGKEMVFIPSDIRKEV